MAKSESTPKPPAPLNLDAGTVKGTKKAEQKFDEQVIKEIMIQKSVDREAAIHILKNPTPHPDAK